MTPFRAAITLGAAVFALATGSAAVAEPAPAALALQPLSPAKEALVRRYLAAIHVERNIASMQAALLPVMTAELARTHPEVTAADRALISDVVMTVLREKMTPQILERFVPIYEQAFTESELTALTTFYESPTGRAITDKIPALAPKAGEILQEILPELQRDLKEELCRRLSCKAPAAISS